MKPGVINTTRKKKTAADEVFTITDIGTVQKPSKPNLNTRVLSDVYL